MVISFKGYSSSLEKYLCLLNKTFGRSEGEAEGFCIFFLGLPTRINMMNRIDNRLNDQKGTSGIVSPRSFQNYLNVQAQMNRNVIAELRPALQNLTHESTQGSLKWLNTMKDLTIALGLSRSSIYSKMRQGLFPCGVKLGASRRWLASDIIAWLEQQRSRGELA